MRKSLAFALASLMALTAVPAFAADAAPATSATPGVTKTRVTMMMPGMKCDKVANFKESAPVYECVTKPGFGGFFDVLRGLMKYGVLLALLSGVLMIVVAGIRYSSVGMLGDGEKEKAKEMIVKVVSGIVALALIGFILNTVAPWVFK